MLRFPIANEFIQSENIFTITDTIKNDILKLFKINQEKIKRILQVSISNDNLIYFISNTKKSEKKK